MKVAATTECHSVVITHHTEHSVIMNSGFEIACCIGVAWRPWKIPTIV